MIGIIMLSFMSAPLQSVSVDDLRLQIPSSGFVEERRRTVQSVSVYYRRSVDRAALTATLARMSDPVRSWKNNSNVSRIGTPEATPSGIPLGDRSAFMPSEGSANLYAQLGSFSTNIHLTYRGRGPVGSIEWQKHDEPGDIALAEGLARYSLARVLGRTLEPGANVSVGGTSISSMRAPGGEVMVSIDRWAAARGISMTHNVRRGSFSFAVQAQAYVGGIAAKALKRAGTWHNMPVPVVRVGNESFIPLATFEELTR